MAGRITWMSVLFVLGWTAPGWAAPGNGDDTGMGPREAWTSNDSASFGFAFAPVQSSLGVVVELGRIRFRALQVTLVRSLVGMMQPDTPDARLFIGGGFLGLGYHHPLTYDRAHEVGLVLFLLGVHFGFDHTDPHQGGQGETSFTRSRERAVLGRTSVQVFYRWNTPRFHVEAALDTSLLWGNGFGYTWDCDDNGKISCSDRDPASEFYKTQEGGGWFSGPPPLVLSVSIGI